MGSQGGSLAGPHIYSEAEKHREPPEVGSTGLVLVTEDPQQGSLNPRQSFGLYSRSVRSSSAPGRDKQALIPTLKAGISYF